MGRTSIEHALGALLRSGLAFERTDVSSRIRQEESGLKRLRHRDDFLGSYDEVIRYMFLLSLMKGCDIRQERVHPALRAFLNACLSIGHGEASEIVSTRHAIKYQGCRPTMVIRMLLSRINRELSVMYGECYGESFDGGNGSESACVVADSDQ
jgi:hypothetical protein